MRIYTRTGDSGETGLLFGGRVSKSDPRCEVYGTADEAVSAMGLARALSQEPRVKDTLLRVQREFFTLGAELATDSQNYPRLKQRDAVVTPQMVEGLERLLDGLQRDVEVPAAFVVPGASAASAALDLARSLVRTAERRAVELRDVGLLPNGEVLRYLNRASDLLFMLARFEDRGAPPELVSGGAA